MSRPSSTSALERRKLQRRRRDSEVVDAKLAVDLATAQTYEENVFLFWPNIIGYTRVILAALSLNYMKTHPKLCTLLYGVSCLLDAADGMAARALGQTSKFGAVLDMVTDRCTTSCLLCYLSAAYADYALLFQFLITLDFSSHYMHMYSSLTTGSESHKKVKSEVSRILSLYYNPKILFIVCAGNELFYVALYLMKSDTSRIGYLFLNLLPHLPAPLARVLLNLTWAQLMAIITFPICALKNIINIVQLWKASKILVGVDLAERAAERAKTAGIIVEEDERSS
jgi:CDP-diacylglycerol--inositol 3-phosphatidyltransferase